MVIESQSDGVQDAVQAMDPKGFIKELGWQNQCRAAGVLCALAYAGYGKVRVVCGKRSLDEQRALYGRGRSEEECCEEGVPSVYAKPDVARVTWITPMGSRHVQGRAIDVDWSSYGDRAYARIGRLLLGIGVTWGGEWSVRDYAHIEW